MTEGFNISVTGFVPIKSGRSLRAFRYNGGTVLYKQLRAKRIRHPETNEVQLFVSATCSTADVSRSCICHPYTCLTARTLLLQLPIGATDVDVKERSLGAGQLEVGHHGLPNASRVQVHRTKHRLQACPVMSTTV